MDRKAIIRVRWYIRRWLGRLTWPWMAAGVVMAMTLGFSFSVLQPASDELNGSRTRLLALQQEIRLAEHTAKPAESSQLTMFYQSFPSEHKLPDAMEKLIAAAANKDLLLPQGEYQVSSEKIGMLLHYQVTLPIKGPYPKIRAFLDQVLTEVPNASLDKVKFERQKVGDSAVDATVMFTLHQGRDS